MIITLYYTDGEFSLERLSSKSVRLEADLENAQEIEHWNKALESHSSMEYNAYEALYAAQEMIELERSLEQYHLEKMIEEERIHDERVLLNWEEECRQ
jgi:hypothetical protein